MATLLLFILGVDGDTLIVHAVADTKDQGKHCLCPYGTWSEHISPDISQKDELETHGYEAYVYSKTSQVSVCVSPLTGLQATLITRNSPNSLPTLSSCFPVTPPPLEAESRQCASSLQWVKILRRKQIPAPLHGSAAWVGSSPGTSVPQTSTQGGRNIKRRHMYQHHRGRQKWDPLQKAKQSQLGSGANSTQFSLLENKILRHKGLV